MNHTLLVNTPTGQLLLHPSLAEHCVSIGRGSTIPTIAFAILALTDNRLSSDQAETLARIFVSHIDEPSEFETAVVIEANIALDERGQATAIRIGPDGGMCFTLTSAGWTLDGFSAQTFDTLMEAFNAYCDETSGEWLK